MQGLDSTNDAAPGTPSSTDAKQSITLWRLCHLDQDRQLAVLRLLLEVGKEDERLKDTGTADSLRGLAVAQSDIAEINCETKAEHSQ
jgi:hypothetical protein